MDKQTQDDQLELTCNSSVPIQDVALKTYWKRLMIEKGGRRGLGRPALVARHDDDDMYEPDLALDNLQWLIYHKPNQNK